MFFIQIAVLLALLAVIGVAANHLSRITLKNSAPFLASGKGVVRKAIENIDVEREMKVYELGCGKADFLKELRKKYPDRELRLTGVEDFIFPLILLNIQNKIFGYNIEIKGEDIFQTDISDADMIYCFLNPKTMEKMKNKFLFECDPGTRIVSYQFSIPGIEPEKIIRYSPTSRILIYQT